MPFRSDELLEQFAEETLRLFDEERLHKIKPLDPYAVIEKCLGVPYDWKFITPDQSILGFTASNDGYFWAWPEPRYRVGMIPEPIPVEKNEIVIDSTLTNDSGKRGRENFTVMHEVFHQLLGHPYSVNVTQMILAGDDHPIDQYSLRMYQRCEIQANRAAADFLMPRALLTRLFYEESGERKLALGYLDARRAISQLAKGFQTSFDAMQIRLEDLQLLYRPEDYDLPQVGATSPEV